MVADSEKLPLVAPHLLSLASLFYATNKSGNQT